MGLLTSGSVIFTLVLFISIIQGIRDGHDAIEDQFPYHAHIRVRGLYNRILSICNGAVINPHFVVTSYDCVWQGQSFLVTLGALIPSPGPGLGQSWTRERARVGQGPTEYTTRQRIYAPPGVGQSNSLTIRNYIALLEFKEKFDLKHFYFAAFGFITTGIEPIELANLLLHKVFADATGYYSDGGEEHLQWLKMQVVNISECTPHFDEDLLQHSVCARGVDEAGNLRGSLCRETTVPLFHQNIFIGILKKFDVSCEGGKPNLFINIHHFSDWIKETMAKRLQNRAIGNAAQNEFPYHAHIEVYTLDNFVIRNCSGAVISSKLVITSSHCVSNGTRFRIRLGSLNPGTEDDKTAYDSVTSQEPFKLPFTISSSMLRPVLLQVIKEIPFNEHIQPVKLPERKSGTIYGYFATATGYFLKEHLQWANMKYMIFQKCLLDSRIPSGSLCLVLDGAYHSDSGSLCNEQGVPVVHHDRRTLVGILDNLDNQFQTCKDGGIAILVSAVGGYVDWIHEIIRKTNK